MVYKISSAQCCVSLLHSIQGNSWITARLGNSLEISGFWRKARQNKITASWINIGNYCQSKC